jgi:predicted ATPase/DNA-binding winged helix-turn-helix (wHTH) protein
VIFRFADCELDLARVVLQRDGREVKLEPQVFDVLAYLVSHRGEVVRKEELLDQIWGDRFVSESALTTRIKSVRQAVGDDGNRQSLIRTVHGKGYEFVASVEAVEASAPAADNPAPPSGLPAAVQPLIGRELLLGLLVEALAEHRLITLVGPGGVGKTSLAFELARTVAGNYPDGVHAVELVSVVDEDATVAAFATAIDVNLAHESSIDVAALVSRILREAPEVEIVATSREPLAVPGEQVWSVDPLSTSGAPGLDDHTFTTIPAVALFVERARAADPAFALDARTAPVVVEICRRLDGIPLAIELAAARARAVDVTEIAARLDERFGLLKAMRRGSDPRHRTMHGAVSWSYDLLEPEEQELFTALSVFAGPFGLESAEAMCTSGDALDLLTRLTERSMLSVRRPAGGATRYELLETLREYGRARLDDARAATLFTAHAAHFEREAAVVESMLQGPEEPRAVAWAEVSFADLRAAQRFALETGNLDTAFGIITAIREFAMRALRYEVFAWADAACRAPGALEHPLAPTLTGMRAYGAWVRGEFDLALSLAEETRRLEVALALPPTGLAERVLGNVLYMVDRSKEANRESARQLELAEASGDGSRLVHACYMASVAFSTEGDLDGAMRLVARAHSEARKTDSPTDLASAAVAQGFASTDADSALEAFLTAERLATSAGNRWMSAFARTEISGLLVQRGDIDEGCAGLAEMVALWQRSGDWSQQWLTLARCVIAFHRTGQIERAAEVLGAIEAHAMLGVAPMSPALRGIAFTIRDEVVAELGTARADELRLAGASCPVEDIVERSRRALLDRLPGE